MDDTPQAPIDGRYRILRELGRGAFGRVDLCVDEETGAEVAVKRLHPVRSNDEIQRRFLREGKAAARVRHPGVVGVLAAGTTPEGDLYLVSSYVEGIELEALLQKEGAREPAQARAWLREMAEALAAIHEAGVVHRDLKPSNILISREHPQICDFGLARIDDGRTLITATGQLVGTPRYLAPEHLRQDDPYSPASDVWALGAIGYQLATGEHWRQPEDLVRIAATDPEDPLPAEYAQRLAAVPDPELREVLGRLLSEDPTRRPADGAAALALLEAPPPAAPTRTEAAKPERSRVPPLAPPLVAACLLLGAWVAFPRGSSPVPPTSPPPATPSVTGRPEATAELDARLQDALAALRLDDEDVIAPKLKGDAEKAALLEAFAAAPALGRWQKLLGVLVEAARAEPPPPSFGATARAVVQVSDNYRRLGVTFEERAITRLFESQYQAQQQETWREVQREFGHAAGDALGRIAYGETPNRSPDHALLQLLLLEMDPHLERARRVAEDLLPYAILVLPQASVELAPELAEQLELALRDAKSSRRLSYETAQDLLAKAAPTLREAGERWPQEVRRSVAKDLLTAAGFLMRRARDDPPAPLLAAFDDLLGQLVDACKGDPERLVRQLHSVQDQMDLPDLLADPPGAEFGVRLEKVLRLRGR